MTHYKNDHLERRGRSFYAKLNVPADAQSTLKTRRFRVALNTRDYGTAKRRSLPLVAEWQQHIAQARELPGVKDDAEFFRKALRAAPTPKDRERIMDRIDEAATHIAYENADPGQKPADVPEARQFVRRAIGEEIRTTEHLDEWIGSLQTKAKTNGMRRQTIERLAAKFPTLAEITRKAVVRWTTELRIDLSGATIQRMMSDCRNYWTYLRSIEAVPEDAAPFNNLAIKVQSQSWKPYEPEEAAKLLGTATGELADLIRLAMFTGARREELCALRIEQIRGDRFEIVDAKTEAGKRVVPIHAELKATVANLIGERKEGFLLAGLDANKNGDRGDAIGKRFSYHKKALGFSERHTFHSFRGTVITMLERAGVPEGTVQDIVGHERHTITGSIYSGKSTLEMRRAALAKLSYPAPPG